MASIQPASREQVETILFLLGYYEAERRGITLITIDRYAASVMIRELRADLFPRMEGRHYS